MIARVRVIGINALKKSTNSVIPAAEKFPVLNTLVNAISSLIVVDGKKINKKPSEREGFYI